jgi:hypothetical protein
MKRSGNKQENRKQQENRKETTDFTARRSRNQRSRATKNTRSHKMGSLKWKSTTDAM